ncbi:MAG TPA: response regulator transcription factor [Flavisolibacter sp.]|nr:response regulator transcription factor [Flavisolibacter sp.]
MRILIADDHAIVRRGLKEILLDEFPSAIIGDASDAEELVEKIFQDEWDLVISDLTMPGRSGLDALKQIKQAFPKLPVLIMSIYPEDQYAVRAFRAGASGYFNKNSIHEELLKAIDSVRKGRKYITPSVAEKLADALPADGQLKPHQMLSDREFEVFKLLASGRTVSEIAQQLSLSANTVSTYRSRILEKMNLHSNNELMRYAFEQNLL